MQIKYLKLANYRSVKLIELYDIPPFSVFIGANGSGKSNFFKGLYQARLKLDWRDDFDIDIKFSTKLDISSENKKTRFVNNICLYKHTKKISCDTWEKLSANPELYDEIVSWLELMVPGTKLSKHEKMSKGAINLVNILIHVSNKPRIGPFIGPFIGLTLIDEPELGLHPKILIELVRKFREYSEKSPIWITTHSETIVRCLKPNELFLVNMVDGETKIKHVNDCDTSNMPLNDMLLSNVLNGGLPY